MRTTPERRSSSKPNSYGKTCPTSPNCSPRSSRKPNTPVSASLENREITSSEQFQTAHEFHEEIEPCFHVQQKLRSENVSELAIDSAHSVAFHRGLGASVFPSSSSPLGQYFNEESIQGFAASAFAKSNISVVANGVSQAELSKWVGQFFTEIPSTSAALSSQATKYYGGEERISHASGNSLVIAFPGSSSFTAGASYKPEIAVLAALLGGKSSIKWSPGFSLLSKVAAGFPGTSLSASNFAYSDAGLLTIQFNGSAAAIRDASAEAVKALKSIAEGTVAKEDITKAVALAKYQVLEEGQNHEAGLVSTGSGLVHGGKAFQIDEVGKAVSAVTAEKLKAVCIPVATCSNVENSTNILIGCKGSFGRQGICVRCWRPARSALRRRYWSQSIEDGIFWLTGIGLYQQLLECTVDIRARLTGALYFLCHKI